MKKEGFREYYIDNLRNFTILLLFPVHTFMVWNDFGSKFYIWQGEQKGLSSFIVLVNPWFMPMLFVLAGISARHALGERTAKEFMAQRARKLLLPFVGGMAFLVPVQSFYARRFFEGYSGGYLAHLKFFFTHVTDFTGYDGAFTPGHLWFILYLFVVSMAALALSQFLPYGKAEKYVERMPAVGILLLFVPIWLFYYLGNVGGFSLGKCFALYLAGYYVLGNGIALGRLERNIWWMAALCVAGSVASVELYYHCSYYGDFWVNFLGWLTVLVLLALGRKFLDKRMWVTEYLNQASYPVYLLHQPILVAVAYYTVQGAEGVAWQAFAVCSGSFVLTVAAYHVVQLMPGVRALVGRKGKPHIKGDRR